MRRSVTATLAILAAWACITTSAQAGYYDDSYPYPPAGYGCGGYKDVGCNGYEGGGDEEVLSTLFGIASIAAGAYGFGGGFGHFGHFGHVSHLFHPFGRGHAHTFCRGFHCW